MKLFAPLLGISVITMSADAHAEALPWGNDQTAPYCREYTSTVKVGNTPQQAHGIACMEPDGTWKIQPQQEEYAEASSPPPPAVEYVPVYAPPPIVSYHVGYGHRPHHRWPHHHWRHRHHHGSHIGFGYGVGF